MMGYPTDRIILFARDGSPLPELGPADLLSRTRVEEVNGERALEVTTYRHIPDGARAITVDRDGTWREWALSEPDETHGDERHALGTYRFVWSLQNDFQETYGPDADHGDATDVGTATAMRAAVAGVPLWTLGRVEPSRASECVMRDNTAWERLAYVRERHGGEVDATICVSDRRVTSRTVELLEHIGSTTATRRFDYGHNVSSIRRTPPPAPYFCRVVPLGDYAKDAEGQSLDHRIGIGGTGYLSDPEAEAAFRRSDGAGGWIYPTKRVVYSDVSDPAELRRVAQEDLHNHTRPEVSYDADVLEFERAGLDVRGVCLGDEVQVVDRCFNPDAALRIQARVLRIEVDELTGKASHLTIGRVRETIARVMSRVREAVREEENEDWQTKFDELDLKFDDVDLKFDEIDTDLSDLDDIVNGFNDKILKISDDVNTQGISISGVVSDMSDLSNDVSGLSGDLSGLSGDLSGLSGSLNGSWDDLAGSYGAFGELNDLVESGGGGGGMPLEWVIQKNGTSVSGGGTINFITRSAEYASTSNP